MTDQELAQAFELALKMTHESAEPGARLTPPASEFVAYLAGIMEARGQTKALDVLAEIGEIDLNWRHEQRRNN